MRKILILSLISIFGIGSLFGAGESEVDEDEPIELVYWSHYGQSPPFVEAFAETANELLPEIGYPNVTMRAEVIEYGDFESVYRSAFESGEGPDVFLANTANWAADGGTHPVAAPLPDDVAEIWDERLAEPFLTSGVLNDTRYGFPAEGGTIQLLYYNKEHFRDAGLDPDDPPRTFDELLEYAQELTIRDDDGDIEQSGYQPRLEGPPGAAVGKFMPFAHQFGARMLSDDGRTAEGYANSSEMVEAFEWYQDLVFEHEVVSLDFGMPEEAFQRGQTSMIVREGWLAQDTIDRAPDIDFGIAPFPAHEENYPGMGHTQMWSNMINQNSPHKEILFDLFEAMATRDADVMLHEAAAYPPVLDETHSMEDDWYSTLPFAEAQMESMELPTPPTYDYAWTSDANEIFADAVIEMLTEDRDVENILDNAAADMQQVLDRL